MAKKTQTPRDPPHSIEWSAQRVLEALAQFGPPGYDSPYMGGRKPADSAAWLGHLGLRWSLPGWGIGATLDVRWSKVNGEKSEDTRFEPEVSVSWSSTHYPPGAAVVAARLHSQVAEFACLLQALLAEHRNIACEAEKDIQTPPEKK